MLMRKKLFNSVDVVKVLSVVRGKFLADSN